MEPRDKAREILAAGPPMPFDWKTLEARGHAVGSTRPAGLPRRHCHSSRRRQMRHDQLAPRVNRLDHISGNCGNVDWVVQRRRPNFTTATTVLCLYSVAAADRPAPYQSLACSGALHRSGLATSRTHRR